MQNLLEFDKAVFEWLILNVNPAWLTHSAEIAGRIELFIWPAIFVFLYGLYKAPRTALLTCVYILLFFLISELTVSFLKSTFMRPRPGMQTGTYVDPRGFSFPSAHAFNIAAIATLISIRVPKLRVIAIFVAFITGAARVFANYHFPLDVIAGWIFGAGFAFVANYVWERLRNFAMNYSSLSKLFP